MHSGTKTPASHSGAFGGKWKASPSTSWRPENTIQQASS